MSEKCNFVKYKTSIKIKEVDNDSEDMTYLSQTKQKYIQRVNKLAAKYLTKNDVPYIYSSTPTPISFFLPRPI